MLWKNCTQYASKFEKTQQNWKRSAFVPIPKKGNAKECSNYCTVLLISHVSKLMLKSLLARLQQYMNCELLDVQARFRKGRGTRNQMANIRWIIEKAREFQKNIYFCITMPKPLIVWIQQTVEHSERDGNTRPPDLTPEKSVYRSRSNSENWTWNNRLVPYRERSTSRVHTVTEIGRASCRERV